MNLTELSKKFNTNKKCIAHLEKARWNGHPTCPVCNGDKVYKRAGTNYWHCNVCNKDSTVLYGTIFEASKLPLPKWFQIITLMLNAKKGISSSQLTRQIDITYKTAWFASMRIRCAMVDEIPLLEGIVEMDEAYLGGKPRYRNSNKTTIAGLTTHPGFEKAKRGRGTKKIPVVGIVERHGKAVVKIMNNLTTKNLLEMLRKNVDMDKAELMTDEFRSYSSMDKYMVHHVIKHVQKEYAKGNIHTNTIEGLWSIIKNGIKGQYHALSRKYLPFYLVEFVYKYNRRHYHQKMSQDFSDIIFSAVEDSKCLTEYKPKGNVDEIVYGEKVGARTAQKPGFVENPAKTKKTMRFAIPESGNKKKDKPKAVKFQIPNHGHSKGMTQYRKFQIPK